jgi:hypothetical protein
MRDSMHTLDWIVVVVTVVVPLAIATVVTELQARRDRRHALRRPADNVDLRVRW